jgi:hypothetical protein
VVGLTAAPLEVYDFNNIYKREKIYIHKKESKKKKYKLWMSQNMKKQGKIQKKKNDLK